MEETKVKITRKQLRYIIQEAMKDENEVPGQREIEIISQEEYTHTESDTIEIVWNIIAKRGESKSYRSDPMGLFVDSMGDTAVGILHFTTSGMKRLYDAMKSSGVIDKYFPGKSHKDLVEYTNTKRGKEGQANGALTSSGVVDVDNSDWWLKGMIAFLDSADSIKVQNRAVISKFTDRIKKYSRFPFRSKRDLAIFISLANSRWSNITTLGPQTADDIDGDWDPDKMMDLYCKQKRRSRCSLTDKYYPKASSRRS